MIFLLSTETSVLDHTFVSLPPAYVVRWEGNVLTPVCVSVHRGEVQVGGVPDPGPGRGGSQVQVGGVPGLSKKKFFWHQIWLDTCLDQKKNFVKGPPPPVKGEIFDTRFGLIHVQTGKKKFLSGGVTQSQ